MTSDEELYRKLVKGQISEDQYLKGVEKNCKHKPEIEETGGGNWIEWCGKCGMKMDSGHNPNLVGTGTGTGSGSSTVVKPGCAVVALLLLGAVMALYGVAELVL
jgi:hypothetical protein